MNMQCGICMNIELGPLNTFKARLRNTIPYIGITNVEDRNNFQIEWMYRL